MNGDWGKKGVRVFQNLGRQYNFAYYLLSYENCREKLHSAGRRGRNLLYTEGNALGNQRFGAAISQVDIGSPLTQPGMRQGFSGGIVLGFRHLRRRTREEVTVSPTVSCFLSRRQVRRGAQYQKHNTTTSPSEPRSCECAIDPESFALQ